MTPAAQIDWKFAWWFDMWMLFGYVESGPGDVSVTVAEWGAGPWDTIVLSEHVWTGRGGVS